LADAIVAAHCKNILYECRFNNHCPALVHRNLGLILCWFPRRTKQTICFMRRISFYASESLLRIGAAKLLMIENKGTKTLDENFMSV